MGNKYHVSASKYPYHGENDYSRGTEKFIVFACMFIKAYFKYEIITIEIRQHKRMRLRKED